MLPTDYEIASLWVMPMLLEVAAGKLILDQAIDKVLSLPLLKATSPAIREC
jgi:hypothetical protein